MDLKLERKAAVQDSREWLGNWAQVVGSNVGVTLLMTDFVKASHYPNRFLPTGLLIAQYTSGGNSGQYGPYTPGASDGRETAIGGIFSGFHVRHDIEGAELATKIHGAVLWANTPVQVFVAKMPTARNNAGTDVAVTASDLPAGWTALPA